MTDPIKSLVDRVMSGYLTSPEFQEGFEQRVREDAEANKEARRRLVDQVNASTAIEGPAPDETERRNQARFIEGEMSGDEMFRFARAYIAKVSSER